MTTEELDQTPPQQQPHQDGLLPQTTAKDSSAESFTGLLKHNRASVLMNDYKQQGWTPLMRNQEATNQVCVNCEINPPVDPEEEESQHLSPLPQEHQPKSDSQQLETKKPNSGPIMSLPPPTSALPAIPSPGPLRPMPSPNNRVSVLDPMMDAVRMNYRTPAGRDSSVLLPSDYPRPPPPPGSTTPLPQPTRTPPPNKRLPGLPTPRLTFPRPPPGPPSLAASCLISPPSSPPAPKLMPRDKRRSPQSSVVVQGNNILLSATPPTRPRAPSRSNLPTPPPSMALDTAPGPNTIDVMIAEQTTHESTEMEERGSDVDDARSRNTGLENRPQAQKEAQMIEEDDEEKGLESHDEFEDAEEEYRPSEEEIRVRESRREQSERASRLIGEKMLQGWTMLQDPCPNSACNGVPLIRNRERKKEYCVICETTFQREQDLEQGKYTIVPPPAPTTSVPSPAIPAPVPASVTTTPHRSISSPMGLPSSFHHTSSFPAPPSTMPPAVHRITSPTVGPSTGSHRVTSPLSSPISARATRDLNGRISIPIVLPPPVPMSPSFGMTSQQILSRHQSEDLDKLASEDEDMRRHMQLIGKVSEFSSRSLPPVPPVPAVHSTSPSRPTSTHSNSSDKERHNRHHLHQTHASQSNNNESSTPPAPRNQSSPEVRAIIEATYKTMSTLLSKLEVYRLALEMSESPKESQVLISQIKGLMECLKACREVL
ncbi:hypothetical protein BGZ54_000768 [Gamsiella multidivaricata]|nr:hypothetical protein BGZ54_000768 [Gamsiella multidivaricata]